MQARSLNVGTSTVRVVDVSINGFALEQIPYPTSGAWQKLFILVAASLAELVWALRFLDHHPCQSVRNVSHSHSGGRAREHPMRRRHPLPGGDRQSPKLAGGPWPAPCWAA